EIAAAESFFVLAEHLADVQTVAAQNLFLRRERLEGLLEPRHRRRAAEFADDVGFGFGNDERLADRATALRDDAADADAAGDECGHGAGVEFLTADEQPIFARAARAAGH